MLPKTPGFTASAKFAAHLCFASIGKSMICIFFAAAMLLIWQVKAQENADQVADFIRQSPDSLIRSNAASSSGHIGKDAKEAVRRNFRCRQRLSKELCSCQSRGR